jgi:hypothetical protein
MRELHNIAGGQAPPCCAQCARPPAAGAVGPYLTLPSVGSETPKVAVYLPGALLCGAALTGVIAASWLAVLAICAAVMWAVKL